MRGGEVNIIHPQPQPQIADIEKKQSNITVQRAASSRGSTWTPAGPGGHPALKRKFVREAIVTAVNRQQIRQVIYKDTARTCPAEQRDLQELPGRVRVAQVPAVRLQPEEGHPLLHAPTAAPAARRPRRPEQRLLVPGRRQAVVRLLLDGRQPAARAGVPDHAGAAPRRRHRAEARSSRLTALTVTSDEEVGHHALRLGRYPDPASSVNIHRCGGDQNYNGYCSRPASRLLLKSNQSSTRRSARRSSTRPTS